MVTFVSLFLWLMTGTHQVQVAVDDTVASVDIVLNGVVIGKVTAPSWQTDCDFGNVLRPHELVAIAKDADGREVGRVSQLVNLPRGDAEVEIVFEGGTAGEPRRVRVVSVNRQQSEPLAIFVTFDGEAVLSDDNGGFPLPDYDPRLVHIVTAEAHFTGGVVARSDVTFGGAYGELVATELTAVPIVVESRTPPTPAELEGLFTARGEALSVAAVEQPGSDVFVVRDHGAWPTLRRTGRSVDRSNWNLRNFRRIHRGGWTAASAVEMDSETERLFTVVPNPSRSRGVVLFPIMVPFDIERWTMPWLMTHINHPSASIAGQRLAEAVAVAGVRAAGGGKPRTVIVILSESPEDASVYKANAVREYLASLRVPLLVWSISDGSPRNDWGPVENIATEGKLRSASRRLEKSLRRQWIVWLEGRHLPNDIELSDQADGFRLPG